MPQLSLLQKERLKYQPQLPNLLQDLAKLNVTAGTSQEKQTPTTLPELRETFSYLSKQDPFITFEISTARKGAPKKVGVVFSGGQAAGGHNVITGLYDALQKLNPQSILYGFLDGPKGILNNKTLLLNEASLANYRNQGGFDLIGSGRTKIETPEQFAAAEVTAKALDLDGIVVVGGDDSNTNAALLAEFFKSRDCKTVVVGVPKTIDGDLSNADIEVSFGFDSAAKTYSEMIGNILSDALSAKKYYHFVKMMGRSASHLTLESALRTQPNMVLIGEEIAEKQLTLEQLTDQMCDLICRRAEQGKDYGMIVIPEGVIEFIPEFRLLIDELNTLLATVSADQVQDKLSPKALKCFKVLPDLTKRQLLMDRDPHGNVQVSQIETERLFIEMVQKELKERSKAKKYNGKFSAQPHFLGYEGRACMPSNFDAQYCYALGHVTALLVQNGLTGYICCVQGLSGLVGNWKIGARNIATMMTLEMRHGKQKPVIRKTLVNLKGERFQKFVRVREDWGLGDLYMSPGPIQFFGPEELTEAPVFLS
ncbi:MAG: diphosphate--fructose-6-phosphate 1-phosphotransferase [Parachlamydiaceae bacterium]|nr:diphosphate--fructose-6-phosphate 1-phosphotransferase [Parachlamydiaceae bacterium]